MIAPPLKLISIPPEGLVRFTDLSLVELLDFQPSGGVIRFAGQRTLLMDAAALGLLRKELFDTVGATVARGVLARLGFAHGWLTARNLEKAFPWDSEREWKQAGGRLHMLQGMVVFEPVKHDETVKGTAPFAEAIWRQSLEAEQHLMHQGKSDEPVCWMLAGYASGYLSFCNKQEIFCIEDRCVGAGDAECHMVGRTREEWGPAGEACLAFYQRECMDVNLAHVTDALKQAESELARKRIEIKKVAETGDDPSGLVVRSEGMRKVVDLARRVAGVDATVLVTGESGVGKERVARLIHESSLRAKGPFVAINCGAVTETLLESELFGHARGSFTGAVHDRPGLFEAAAGGTLFLDEIGEVSPALQVKLLRALQEREVRRVGENKTRSVDVRVVAATNRNLAEQVSAGQFRQDLYYRLRVIELHIPPLRERKDDVLPLVRAMLARASQRLGRKVTGFTPEAADQLQRYAWPGNVRELENAVERAVVLSQDARVTVEDLPEEIRNVRPQLSLQGPVQPLEDVERAYILAALRTNQGNQARTAAQLKIGTATLYRKLKQYDRDGAER